MTALQNPEKSLVDITPGTEARVIAFNGLGVKQIESLQAYGLAPGSLVKVVRHKPVTIIQVDNTELALEHDLAIQVKVE
jgi:Fe2+ transport system protein FeoA